MKKMIIFCAIILAGYLNVEANDADLFKYDKTAVNNSLSELTTLESYFAEHPALTNVSETANGNLMINGIELTANPMQGRVWGPVPFPYFWGCVFGPIGVLVVMAGTNGDRRAEWFAMEGCITALIFWSIFYVAYYGPAYNYYYYR